MTLTILALLKSVWPFLVAGVGVVYGIFKHTQTTTAKAEAETAKAQASDAKADAASAQQALVSVQAAQTVKQDIETKTQATTGSALDKAITDEGFVG